MSKKIFSGVQPTGNLHLGNYLGAIKNFVDLNNDIANECIFCVVDLHAITVKQDPKELRSNIQETVATFIASGIDPKKSIIFNQSKVPAHAEGAWILSCVAKFRAGFYKWTGFKALMERMKSGVFLSYQNHYGILARKNNWNQLSEQTQRILGLYGIDDSMWNMMRKTTLKKFEGYDLLTIDDLAELPKDNIIDYLKKTQPKLTKISDAKIKQTRNEIQSRWRMFLYSRVHMGILEPGARERAYLNQGLTRGSTSGLLARLITKFKSFPLTVYTKKLEVLVKGSGEDIKASNYLPALTYYTVLGTVFGYASLSFADMLMGKEPRDPTDPKTMAASMAKGGGASIIGDLLYQEISRSNGGAASTILGPAFADLEGLINVLKNTAQGKFDKAGLKAYRLFEANTPIDIWYLRPVYNYLIGYHIKDILDPGYFDRLEGYTKRATGQDFYNYIKP